MNESVGSKASGSEEEPLVPDDFDDEFFKALTEKLPEVTKALRQKDTCDNADNVQRLLICCNRYKSDLHVERMHSQELRDEIAELQQRLEDASQMSKHDQETIQELKSVIEGAWKQKDAAQMREQIAQDEMQRLRDKLVELEETVQRLSDKHRGLQSKRDDHKERERLNAEVRDLNKRLQAQRSYTSEIETTAHTLEEKNKELLKLLDETSSEAYNSKKRIETLQKELDTLKAEGVKLNERISQMKSQTAHLTKMKVRQNLQILSLKTNLEHLHSTHNITCNKLAKVTVDLEYAAKERDKNKQDLLQRANMLKMREDEIIKLKQENAKLAKSQDSTARKYSSLDESRRAAQEENTRLKTQLSTQEKELDAIRRVVQHFEKNNENITKERDVLKRDLMLAHRSAEEIESLLQESQHEVKSLKDAIHLMDVKYKKLVDDFAKLNKEKAKKVEEVQSWIEKIDALQNDIQLKQNQEVELKRTINDLEAKCIKLQAHLDASINEKNALQRNLQAVEDEKTNLRQQLKSLQSSIETLQTKLGYRNAEISKLQLQIDRMEKERRMLRANIRKCQLGRQHISAELQEKKKENDRYSKSLQEDELTLARLRKELDHMMDEKNAITAALTKRNDEYAKLKDDLNNLQTAYDQTEKQFAQCQDDMRLMRIEIKNLRTERNVLRKDRENAADLRQELLQMHRMLNQERVKARALQEEMMTPMNVHRWRNLAGTDPEKMDLINRIQALRKQMLHQNVASLKQERALQEAQLLYAALKEFMQKLPSHKIREELNTVKATLSAKDRKLKALMAELSATQADEKSNVVKLEEIKSNLASTKQQLTQEKKRKQKLLEERHILVQMQAQCFSAPPQIQRTLGAGFKMIGTF